MANKARKGKHCQWHQEGGGRFKGLHPGRIMMGQKWVFAPDGTRGMAEVSLTKMGGGAIQGIETPIMTLSFLGKFSHPGRVRRG